MGKFLTVLVILLVVVALAQIARVYELSSELRKRREEDVPDADNRFNARLFPIFMLALYASFIWMIFEYKDDMALFQLPASEHGVAVDNLYLFNWVILFVAFFLVQTLLFTFAARYYRKKGVKAHFFPHDNRLELVWTIIPSIVLAVIIIYGLTIWNRITDEADENALVIEVYSRQFDWTVRYPGPDGKLGASDYRLISATNPLGLVSARTIREKMDELKAEGEKLTNQIQNEVLPDSRVEELQERIDRMARHRTNLYKLLEAPFDTLLNFADDDIMVKGEFVLPKNREVKMLFRSQDVIHSAYMPHFRAQMNTVPGMTTSLKMTPTVTTDSMRLVHQNPEFNYLLLCNKVCGAAHYNMQMNIVVDEETAFEQWLTEQKPFYAPEEEQVGEVNIELTEN
jgi:cytochrome c oxidase subunit 2